MPIDHRAQFERDFDRAIFSTPVKRLQDKAQVFPLEPHDAVRTRLTHSLEVSSVARGLGIALGKWLVEQKEIQPGREREVEAIAATCGLIHDLGNPPFGHAGEDAIRTWFEKIGKRKLTTQLGGVKQRVCDLLTFEGNAQTIRLVSKLQILADFHGLNLTFGTLSAACKYIARSDEAQSRHLDHAKSKPGYFSSENSLIKRIRKETGTGPARNPITFLVEAADDIVYSVADIEDGVKKGIISWIGVEKEMDTSDPFMKGVLNTKGEILRAGAKMISPNLPDDVHAAAFRTAAISKLVPACMSAFQRHYEEIMQGRFPNELVKAAEGSDFVAKLKRFGRMKIYNTSSTLKLEIMGRNIIHDLMELFWEGAEKLSIDGQISTKDFPGRVGALLSKNYRDVFCDAAAVELGPKTMYHRYQLVTDQVCGMTDTFAKRLHAELMNG
jgi:dGTPase